MSATPGRNDPCPCGSGKKYKKCCGLRPADPFEVWRANATSILREVPQAPIIRDTCFAVLSRIEYMGWSGACHATTAILHVLLDHQGVESVPCVGEAQLPAGFFDHSWVEINGEPYDMAIALPLEPRLRVPPVFKGHDVESMTPSMVRYGVHSGLPDTSADMVKSQSFAQYADGYPDHRDGLWGVVVEIGSPLGLRLRASELRAAHLNTEWVVR